MVAMVPTMAPKAASGNALPPPRRRRAPLNSSAEFCLAIAGPLAGAAAAGRKSKLPNAIAAAVVTMSVVFSIVSLQFVAAISRERRRFGAAVAKFNSRENDGVPLNAH